MILLRWEIFSGPHNFYTGIWGHQKISVPNKKNFDNTQSK